MAFIFPKLNYVFTNFSAEIGNLKLKNEPFQFHYVLFNLF